MPLIISVCPWLPKALNEKCDYYWIYIHSLIPKTIGGILSGNIGCSHSLFLINCVRARFYDGVTPWSRQEHGKEVKLEWYGEKIAAFASHHASWATARELSEVWRGKLTVWNQYEGTVLALFCFCFFFCIEFTSPIQIPSMRNNYVNLVMARLNAFCIVKRISIWMFARNGLSFHDICIVEHRSQIYQNWVDYN